MQYEEVAAVRTRIAALDLGVIHALLTAIRMSFNMPAGKGPRLTFR